MIDAYGATDPAEFFAVVTEAFFERPAALADEQPALYAVLSGYHGLDPRAW
ncbi:zinc-dependent peptidase [Piscinibacter sakaiensis]|uniref:zinc-dependent peptidase n=1 Tax=Piscinibacter sakaiensis TaxID=1547922 RepID=UPI00372AC8FC